MIITTAEQLAEAIVSDPERVAACLGRINRFGGQVPNCTVLRHSLHVFERIDADPDSLDAARLWALLHDCHEVLTGDVVRPYVTARLRMDQAAIDAVIVRRLPLLVPQPESIEWGRVAAADRAVGEFEIQQIEQDRAPYDLYTFAVASWSSLVRELIRIGVRRDSCEYQTPQPAGSDAGAVGRPDGAILRGTPDPQGGRHGERRPQRRVETEDTANAGRVAGVAG